MKAPLTPEAAAAATSADMARIVAALSAARGNVRVAAVALGIQRRTLDRRIVSYGLREWLSDTYPWSDRQPRKRSQPHRVTGR